MAAWEQIFALGKDGDTLLQLEEIPVVHLQWGFGDADAEYGQFSKFQMCFSA